MFYAGGAATYVYNLTMDPPTGSDESGRAEFEIDGQPPPQGTPCFLTVSDPPRKYGVRITHIAAIDGGKRTGIRAIISLVR